MQHATCKKQHATCNMRADYRMCCNMQHPKHNTQHVTPHLCRGDRRDDRDEQLVAEQVELTGALARSVARSCMSHVACCALHVACRVPRAACRMLYLRREGPAVTVGFGSTIFCFVSGSEARTISSVTGLPWTASTLRIVTILLLFGISIRNQSCMM